MKNYLSEIRTKNVFSFFLVTLLLLMSSVCYAQFQKGFCNNSNYRLYNDNDDLYLLDTDRWYKYNETTNNFDLFFTKSNAYNQNLGIFSHLQFNKGKFYYFEAFYNPCNLYCEVHYFYNGTHLDSLIFHSVNPGPNEFGMASAFIDSTLYFATMKHVFKSDYTEAGTDTIYTMPEFYDQPNFIAEQIEDIKSFNNAIYLVELHEFSSTGNKCYLKKYDGASWSTVDSSNYYITLHQGKNNLFYNLTESGNSLANCKVAAINPNGVVTTLYAGNTNSRFFTSGVIGSIKDNLFLMAVEKDTSGLNLFPNRSVVCKVNSSEISMLNITTHEKAMPANPFSYWISGNLAAISNDNVMYFVASDTNSTTMGNGNQVWVTDGTNSGTKKIAIPNTNSENDLEDAFYFNRSVGMCRDNLYVMFDPDGLGSMPPQLTLCDRYGNQQRIFSLHPDANDYDNRYQNIASYKNSIIVVADTTTSAQENCVFKNDACLYSTGIVEKNNSGAFLLYPNPTNGVINISTNKNLLNATVKIFDLVGNVIFESGNIVGRNFTFDISTKAAAGLYFLEISDNGKLERVKIIKE